MTKRQCCVLEGRKASPSGKCGVRGKSYGVKRGDFYAEQNCGVTSKVWCVG